MKKLAVVITLAISINLIGCSAKIENDKPDNNKEIKMK